MYREISRWLSTGIMLIVPWISLSAQENDLSKTQEKWNRYKATTLVKVVGGNLPKGIKDEGFRVNYEGRMVDINGQRRVIGVEFRLDKQEYNRWIATLYISGIDMVEVSLQDPSLRQWQDDHDTLWLDFNNYGQLARLMDMSGMVKDTDEAFAYVRYVLNDDTEAYFVLHFGIFAQKGNFLTQYKGRAMATLVSDGYGSS